MNKLLFKVMMLPLLASTLFSCNPDTAISDAYGNFEANEVMVSAQANGQLILFEAIEGMALEKGQIVGLIDTIDLHLKKMQAISQHQAVLSKFVTIDAQIEAQLQQLQNLRTEKDRIARLLEGGAATTKQKDDVDGAYSLADKQLKATQAQKQSVRAEAEVILTQIAQLDEQIKKSHITNPIEGIILTKFAESGEVVTFGKPLYKIANLGSLDLKIYVSGAQLADFKLGQQVDVLIDQSANEHRMLKGTISWISSQAEFTPKTIQTKEERVDLMYAAKVNVINDGSLKIGMPAEIRIIH